MADGSSVTPGSAERQIPTLLDDDALGRLHEDFASTGDLDELAEVAAQCGPETLSVVTNVTQRQDIEALRRSRAPQLMHEQQFVLGVDYGHPQRSVDRPGPLANAHRWS